MWGSYLLFAFLFVTLPATARDLEAVADGEHLWLIEEDPEATDEDGPRRLIYHTSVDAESGALFKLDPIKGGLMSRGFAAGDGRLLMVDEDRQLLTLRPVWSDLLKRYMYDRQTLPALPEGCSLLSLAIGARGPWALVLVEDAALIAHLEPRVNKDSTPLDRKMLNRALGLPDDYELNLSGDKSEQTPEEKEESEDQAPVNEEESAEQASAEADVDAAGDKPSRQPVRELRLICLQGGRWVSVPLPDGFPDPKQAALVMADDDTRPTLVIETEPTSQVGPSLIRYSPIWPNEDAEQPAWAENITTPRPGIGKLWAAAMVDGQTVLTVESGRTMNRLWLDAYLLRGNNANKFGQFSLTTQDKTRWSAVPWRGGLAAVARPGPAWTVELEQVVPTAPLGSLVTIGFNGEPIMVTGTASSVVLLHEPEEQASDGNADLYIQIVTFASAMVLMLLFYRRAPRPEQIDLPDNVMLASFGRRLIAGFVDLGPGFFVAGVMYDTTINETMLYWPGNGVPKVLSAMRPGFIVIAVTILHTTIFEFITARSMGKWLTGMYVADLSGKPAAPVPCLIRSVSRAFDLFAPLMLVVALISPARQRLGDILAKTTVVMSKPEPIEQEDEQ